MEDKEDGLLLAAAELLPNESLMLAEQLRVEFNVAGLVHSVYARLWVSKVCVERGRR